MTWIPFAVDSLNDMTIATDVSNGNEVYVFNATKMYSATYAMALAQKELTALVAGKMMVMRLSEHNINWLNGYKRIVEDIDRERLRKEKAIKPNG